MRENEYRVLGLSSEEIAKIKKCKLGHLLDKIRLQQTRSEKHEKQLNLALAKIKKDLEVAREVQMSLLPRGLSGVSQLEFKARFHPSQYVSGDIYNVFRLDEDHIGLYHIDISGHGVPAALFSVGLSQILNTTISKTNLLKIPAKYPPYYKINPPDRVIGILNDDQSFERNGIYFTMVYMIINLKDSIIQYTRAGHNPPVLIKKDGSFILKEDGGFPVGWDFPRDDPIVELKAEPGDRLFMFSDGITEAGNQKHELFSTERLLDILIDTRTKTLEQSLDTVISSVKQFSGRKDFEDDVSLVGLAWL